LEDVGARIRRVRDEPTGTLRVGLSTAFGKMIVVPLLPELKRRYPDITLEIHHDDRLVDLIAEGYDVVIRVGRSEDSLLTTRKIAVVHRGLFCAKSLVERLGAIERPEDLARYPALLFGSRVPVAPQWHLSRGRRRVTVPIPSATSVDQLDSLYALVGYGLGVAYAPLFLSDATLSRMPIERVLPDWSVGHRLEPSSGVYALFAGGERASAKVHAFVDYLGEKLSDLARARPA
jgi:DNA-binding transcriptional LysR family regulator